MIPGIVISVLTFPGVIVHELGHQLFCRLARVAVFDVCYFRFGRPAGYVIHEPPRSAYQNVLIDIGPFLLNTLVGALITLSTAYPVWRLDATLPLGMVTTWLGVSIAMHAFPSTGDAKALWQSVVAGRAPVLLKIVAVPLVLLIYAGAIGSFFWLDLFYGIGVAVFLPELIVQLLA